MLQVYVIVKRRIRIANGDIKRTALIFGWPAFRKIRQTSFLFFIVSQISKLSKALQLEKQ